MLIIVILNNFVENKKMTFNKNKIVEKSIIILILLLAFFSVKYYKISNDFQTFIGTVELEKKY